LYSIQNRVVVLRYGAASPFLGRGIGKAKQRLQRCIATATQRVCRVYQRPSGVDRWGFVEYAGVLIRSGLGFGNR